MRKPFDQLTARGRLQRLKRLAANALSEYDLAVAAIEPVGLFTNAIFRLRTSNGRFYIMRVCRPGWRTEMDLRSEVIWLQALGRDTSLRVPEPQPARGGDYIVEAAAGGVPEPRRCLVMDHLPGIPLGKRLNEENLYKMGVLFAALHAHGANFQPPPHFTTRKMDNIYARGEEDVLFSSANQNAFTPETREILLQTDRTVQEAFARLYSDPLGLQVIHNDLHHDNIKVYRGQLLPFDFEDTIWGYPVQDIAMAMQDLMMEVTPETFDLLQNAFRDGYESRRAWPAKPGEIDTLRAGRMIWVTNYVARYQRQYLRRHIDWLAPHLARFLDTGRLSLDS